MNCLIHLVFLKSLFFLFSAFVHFLLKEPFFVVNFLECEDFNLFIRKFTKISKKLIIPIKCMISCELPVAIFSQLGDFFLILVEVLLIQFCCKNYETSYFNTSKEVFKYFDWQIAVINQTSACHKIKAVNEIFRNNWPFDSKNASLYIFIHLFLFSA